MFHNISRPFQLIKLSDHRTAWHSVEVKELSEMFEGKASFLKAGGWLAGPSGSFEASTDVTKSRLGEDGWTGNIDWEFRLGSYWVI